MTNKTYTFKRYCKRCNKLFHPSGKFMKLCDSCKLKSKLGRRNK